MNTLYQKGHPFTLWFWDVLFLGPGKILQPHPASWRPGTLRLMPVLFWGLHLDSLSRTAVLDLLSQGLKETSSGVSFLPVGGFLFLSEEAQTSSCDHAGSTRMNADARFLISCILSLLLPLRYKLDLRSSDPHCL